MSKKPAYSGDYANDPLDVIGIETDELTNEDGTAKNNDYQRIIRGVIGLVLMSPDAMRR